MIGIDIIYVQIWVFFRLYTPTQNNFQYKKQGPSPISLVRATRIFSKAKTLKRKMICHWTFEKKEKEFFLG